jgi:hypothetical protein
MSDYLQVEFGTKSVMVRKADLRINAVHILHAAGRDRAELKSIRKANVPFDIVKGHATYQGTYVDSGFGLQLCRKYNLTELEGLLTKTIEGGCTVSSPPAHVPIPSSRKRLQFSEENYFQTSMGAFPVSIRRADYRVNATHILKHADQGKEGLEKIRKSGVEFDII